MLRDACIYVYWRHTYPRLSSQAAMVGIAAVLAEREAAGGTPLEPAVRLAEALRADATRT